MSEKKWIINLTNIDSGIFRTMNGNADEMIAVGRIIKAGFPCSRVDVTNAKYDAIVDLWDIKSFLEYKLKELVRILSVLQAVIVVESKLIEQFKAVLINTRKKTVI